jgi:hypothetical protein
MRRLKTNEIAPLDEASETVKWADWLNGSAETTDVCFGSEDDMRSRLSDLRFYLNVGHRSAHF